MCRIIELLLRPEAEVCGDLVLAKSKAGINSCEEEAVRGKLFLLAPLAIFDPPKGAAGGGVRCLLGALDILTELSGQVGISLDCHVNSLVQ